MAREYLSRLKPTQAQVHKGYLAELELRNQQRNAAGLPELLKFSLTKTKNAIARFDEFEAMAAREGEEAALRHFRDVKGSFEVERPGAHIEIDEWKGDLITLLVKTGVWAHLPECSSMLCQDFTCCVTVAIDVATRYVLGVKITPSPSAEAIAGVLRMVMVDKMTFRGWSERKPTGLPCKARPRFGGQRRGDDLRSLYHRCTVDRGQLSFVSLRVNLRDAHSSSDSSAPLAR